MIFGDKGGYIFLENNDVNIKKTDFKDFQISSWDGLEKPPFWWSFDPKTIPFGEFVISLTVYRRLLECNIKNESPHDSQIIRSRNIGPKILDQKYRFAMKLKVDQKRV